MGDNPFLPFRPTEAREYGSIRLFDAASATTAALPFRYSKFVVAPGNTSRLDQHEVLEVWVILAGTGTLKTDGDESPVAGGDVVHFSSMRNHQVTNTGPDNLEVYSFWWKNE